TVRRSANGAMFARLPPYSGISESTSSTLLPAATSSCASVAPMKPRPPVISTRLFAKTSARSGAIKAVRSRDDEALHLVVDRELARDLATVAHGDRLELCDVDVRPIGLLTGVSGRASHRRDAAGRALAVQEDVRSRRREQDLECLFPCRDDVDE